MTESERVSELLSEMLLNEQVKDRVNEVLEQIRAEIESEIRDVKANATEFGNAPIRFFNKGVRKALNIIDKHTKGDTDADSD